MKYKIGTYLKQTGVFANNYTYKIVGITDTKHYIVRTINTNWTVNEPFHYVDCPNYYVVVPRNEGIVFELLYGKKL